MRVVLKKPLFACIAEEISHSTKSNRTVSHIELTEGDIRRLKLENPPLRALDFGPGSFIFGYPIHLEGST